MLGRPSGSLAKPNTGIIVHVANVKVAILDGTRNIVTTSARNSRQTCSEASLGDATAARPTATKKRDNVAADLVPRKASSNVGLAARGIDFVLDLLDDAVTIDAVQVVAAAAPHRGRALKELAWGRGAAGPREARPLHGSRLSVSRGEAGHGDGIGVFDVDLIA